MRRTEHYTALPETIIKPPPETYRDSFSKLSLLAKISVSLRMWLKGETLDEAVREREYHSIRRQLERDHQDIVDPAAPALMHGFCDRVYELAKRLGSIGTVVDEAVGARAGRFLQKLLASIDPETAEQLESAIRVPEETLDDPDVTLEAANRSMKEQVQQTLELHQATILRDLGPTWTALMGLRNLAKVPLKELVPARTSKGSRVPLRIVKDPLIELYRALEFCRDHQSSHGLDAAADFATQRLGRNFSAYRGIWDTIDEFLTAVPFLDLIRLALEEPRAKVKKIKLDQSWWRTFEDEWMDSYDAGPAIIRHRAYRIEAILHDDFAVAAPMVTWIPTSLFQRTVGSLRRLATGSEFRLTRVFVSTIAREEGLLRPTSRKDLLNAHVLLDQQIDKLEELLGSGENRGKLGEEIKRLHQEQSDAAMVRIHMTGLLARFRPPVQMLVNQSLSALGTIRRVCRAEERTIVKSFPRLNALLSDTLGGATPRYVLDLIIHRYGPLAELMRGLYAIEAEMSAGTESEAEALLEGDGSDSGGSATGISTLDGDVEE
jgi:hypothetical protein